jgi:hypothetical protein
MIRETCSCGATVETDETGAWGAPMVERWRAEHHHDRQTAPCVCGQPSDLRVRHRADGPCFVDDCRAAVEHLADLEIDRGRDES